jgi:hypothetical protein
MKGIVEVYQNNPNGEPTLLIREDNLIMDGAAESITDFLSMPSSVAIRGDVVHSKVLDASNYILQGFAVGKGTKGYLENIHKYKRHNLIDRASKIATPGSFNHQKVNTTLTIFEEKSPFDLSSDVLGAYGLDGLTAGASSFLTFSSNTFSNNAFSGMVTAPMIFTVDIKYDHEHPVLPLTSPNAGRGITTLRMTRNGSEVSGILQWIGNGASLFPITGNTLVKNLGSGWFRVGLVSPSGVDDSTNVEVVIHPCGEGTEVIGVTPCTWSSSVPSGGIYISRPSLNVGSIPINYFLGDEPSFSEEWDVSTGFPLLASSIAGLSSLDLNPSSGVVILPNRQGSLRHNISGYDPINSLPEAQNPVLSGISPGAITDYARNTECTVRADHNVNYNGFVYRSNNYKHIDSSWITCSAYDLLPILQDARWFGGYASECSAVYMVVSSLDKDHIETSGVANSIRSTLGINSVGRSTDISGYTRFQYGELGEITSASAYYMKCINADPANGMVEYNLGMSDDDVLFLESTGGLMTMGLYSLDYRKVLANGTPSTRSLNKSVDTGDELYFKLFSRKVFNDSLSSASDITVSPGIKNHAGITVIWRLDFI